MLQTIIMASSLRIPRLSEMINTAKLVEIFQSHPAAILSTLGFAILLPLAINDYRIYLSYGPGGLPYNVKGWLIACTLRVISGEQHSTAPYDNPRLPFNNEPGYLPANFPPKRSSSKPRLSIHPAPQRQLDQLPGDAMRNELIKRCDELGEKAQQRGIVEVKQSYYERQHAALFVSSKRNWHSVAQQSHGEISHVHAGLDGTVHMILHPKDCKKIFKSGWGQRHGFSGHPILGKLERTRLPVNFVLIYAPRDQAELEIVMKILEAAVQFMTGTRESVV
jgi:hypothetical protein